jgi:hypothetical protein
LTTILLTFVLTIGMKKILTALALTQLGACASFLANTPAELFTSTHQSPPYNYKETKDAIQTRIKSYLVSCYGAGGGSSMMMTGGAVFSMPGIKFDVLEMHETALIKYAVSTKMTGQYVLGVQIRDVSVSNASEMTVYAGNRFWEDRFSTLNDVALGKSATCPYN